MTHLAREALALANRLERAPVSEIVFTDVGRRNVVLLNSKTVDYLTVEHRDFIVAALRNDLSTPTNDWQDFATAPKDGTPILCYCPDDVFNPITGIELIWWEPSIRHWTQDGDNKINFGRRPTHWRHLPADPTPRETVAEKTSSCGTCDGSGYVYALDSDVRACCPSCNYDIQESDGGVEGHPQQATGEPESADVREAAGIKPGPSDPNERRTNCPNGLDHGACFYPKCVSSCPGRLAAPINERRTARDNLVGRLRNPDSFMTSEGAALCAEAADKIETAWLIEKDDPPVYHQLIYDDDWTFDANKAVRFARREDAQAYIDYIGWTEPKAVEHIWCEPRATLPVPDERRTALTLSRDVTKTECPWLDDDIPKGTVLFKYSGHTYGCIGSGVAVTWGPGQTLFFEIPHDATLPIPERETALRDALRPFAKIADAYDGSPDGLIIRTELGLFLTWFRAARAALAAVTSPEQEGK